MRVLYFMLQLRSIYTVEYTHNQTRCITLELSIYCFSSVLNNPLFFFFFFFTNKFSPYKPSFAVIADLAGAPTTGGLKKRH